MCERGSVRGRVAEERGENEGVLVYVSTATEREKRLYTSMACPAPAP